MSVDISALTLIVVEPSSWVFLDTIIWQAKEENFKYHPKGVYQAGLPNLRPPPVHQAAAEVEDVLGLPVRREPVAVDEDDLPEAALGPGPVVVQGAE